MHFEYFLLLFRLNKFPNVSPILIFITFNRIETITTFMSSKRHAKKLLLVLHKEWYYILLPIISLFHQWHILSHQLANVTSISHINNQCYCTFNINIFNRAVHILSSQKNYKQQPSFSSLKNPRNFHFKSANHIHSKNKKEIVLCSLISLV